jgi:hypothetical protein
MEKQLTGFVVKFVVVAVLLALCVIAASASIRITGHSSWGPDAAVQDAASHIAEECIQSGAAPYPTYSYTVVSKGNDNPNSVSGNWWAVIETDCQP